MTIPVHCEPSVNYFRLVQARPFPSRSVPRTMQASALLRWPALIRHASRAQGHRDVQLMS